MLTDLLIFPRVMRIVRMFSRSHRFILCCLLLIHLTGCASDPQRARVPELDAPASEPAPLAAQIPASGREPRLRPVELSGGAEVIAREQSVALEGAKNEWISLLIQVESLPAPRNKRVHFLRFNPMIADAAGALVPVSAFRAYQVLSMPIDTNLAGYVRHTGLSTAVHEMPRALVPLSLDGGRVNLTTARDPSRPREVFAYPGAAQAGPLLLWIDLQVPLDTPPGSYQGSIDLLETGGEAPLSVVPLRLTVYDFVLPDDRNLVIAGQLSWESLTRLYSDRFEAITPRLINRRDERYAPAIQTLDDFVKLAQAHRLEVVVPRLQPTVKWPANRPPQIDWNEFDELVGPWLSGDAFPDKIPPGFWPLPAPDFLSQYDRKSQLEYWLDAATHFDQLDWLARSAVVIESPTSGRAGTAQSIALSSMAARILATHPRVRVSLPLEDDQVQFATPSNPNLIDPQTSSRLITAAPNLVFAPPIQQWLTDAARPARYLRTDVTGLLPYFGAGGDDRDVRLWAWLAFLRQARLIQWPAILPRASGPDQPADPGELIWFYPGSWFGLDKPVATVQLKWLRRAQQDFEYLRLCWERGERIGPTLMARLITKPVQIQPAQVPDPSYALMCGTSDAQAWDAALRLLARTILFREPGQEADPVQQHALNLATLQWIAPQERPILLSQSVQWLVDPIRGGPGETWLGVRLGIDMYNASDSTPDQNTLQWTSLPAGWQETRPQPVSISALAGYQVARFFLNGRFNAEAISPASRRPVEVTFVNGFSKQNSLLKTILPVAASERREGGLKIDGLLGDWDPADNIQDGPLVKMLDRPTLQQQGISYASTPSQIFSGWADDTFYTAFKVSGMSPSEGRNARNFAQYESRRAWAEDLTEILIQPVFHDNSLGPIMHLVCKPNGSIWVERKLDPKMHADPWQPFEGAAIRYAADVNGSDWRGEVAIPWKAITDDPRKRPVLLRFNFTQNKMQTGESATWAGPVDFGRDDALTGALFIREQDNPGMGGTGGR